LNTKPILTLSSNALHYFTFPGAVHNTTGPWLAGTKGTDDAGRVTGMTCSIRVESKEGVPGKLAEFWVFQNAMVRNTTRHDGESQEAALEHKPSFLTEGTYHTTFKRQSHVCILIAQPIFGHRHGESPRTVEKRPPNQGYARSVYTQPHQIHEW